MTDQTKLGQWDRTIRNCQVVDIPAGDAPKYISVRLPGENGELIDAWWSGSPALSTSDYVKLLRQVDVPQYEVIGTSGATPSVPALHGHSADVVTVDTAGFAGNLSAADDTVQKALDTLDDLPTSGGGWPFDQILTVSTTNAGADHSTIAAAIAAAGSSDGILLDGETFTETVTLNVFAYLKGYDRGVSVISGKVTSSAGAILEAVAVSVASAEAIEITTSRGTLRECRIVATTGSGLKGIYDRRGCDLYDTTAEANGGSGNQYALYCSPSTSQTTNVYGGLYRGATADIYADTNATINLFGPVLYNASNTVYPIAGAGVVKGHYYDLAGNLYFARGQSGLQAGVWMIDESAGLEVKYADLAAAVAGAASSGDSIIMKADTYAFTSQVAIGKSLTIEGNGPEATILDFNLANNACFDFTADNTTIVFRNLTIDHSAGGSTLAGVLFTNNAGVKIILDNCIAKKSGGAPTTGYGAWLLAGTLELRNGSKLLCTSGTSQYGFLNDSSGDATLIIGPGCEVGGATADAYSNRAGSVLQVQDCIFTNGYTDWAGDVNGQYHGAKLVTNASGATAPGRDIGYINADGDYVTTTTANVFSSNCVVVVSGGSTKKCFVATAGRWPVRYAGSAPSDGDFLVTSTTAGAAGLQATMRPEVFARCQAAGSGNVVTALLLCNTTYIPYLSSNNIYRCDSHASSIFVATINGSPSSTSVVYNAPSSGQENVLPPNASTELAKLMLYNSTRGTYRLITACNTGTNTITTIASTDSWASGDTITIANATIGDPLTERFVGFDLSQQTEIPLLARAITINHLSSDSGGAGYGSQFHPYEAYSSAKIINSTITNSTAQIVGNISMPLINQRFGKRETASGTSTKLTILKISGYWLAAP